MLSHYTSFFSCTQKSKELMDAPQLDVVAMATYILQHQQQQQQQQQPKAQEGPLTDIQVVQRTLAAIDLPGGGIGGPALAALTNGPSAAVTGIGWQQALTAIIREHEQEAPKLIAHLRRNAGAPPRAEDEAAAEAVSLALRILRLRLTRPILCDAVEKERFQQHLPPRLLPDDLNKMLLSIGRRDLVPTRKRNREERQ